MQRFFDLLLSGLGLVILTPLLLPIALILHVTGEGEIFYVQQRVGRNGRSFGLYKFATMLKESPKLGHGEITVKDDPRVLPFGKFLRKTKINELPQLFNILKGDISVIGPRPIPPKMFEQYDRQAREDLCQVRPGLTGVGSIIFRDEERFLDNREDPVRFYREIIMPYKTEVERWYIRNQSLWLYFVLIFLTAWVIPFPRSALPRHVLGDLPEAPPELQTA